MAALFFPILLFYILSSTVCPIMALQSSLITRVSVYAQCNHCYSFLLNVVMLILNLCFTRMFGELLVWNKCYREDIE